MVIPVNLTTLSGCTIALDDPKPADLLIEDIARGLSRVAVGFGQTREFCSYAERAVMLSHAVPEEDALSALLCEAWRFVIGTGMACGKMQHAVETRFGVRPFTAPVEFERAQSNALVLGIEPLFGEPVAFLCYPPARAEVLFLLRFYELTA
jgi:hypothetical protein